MGTRRFSTFRKSILTDSDRGDRKKKKKKKKKPPPHRRPTAGLLRATQFESKSHIAHRSMSRNESHIAHRSICSWSPSWIRPGVKPEVRAASLDHSTETIPNTTNGCKIHVTS